MIKNERRQRRNETLEEGIYEQGWRAEYQPTRLTRLDNGWSGQLVNKYSIKEFGYELNKEQFQRLTY